MFPLNISISLRRRLCYSISWPPDCDQRRLVTYRVAAHSAHQRLRFLASNAGKRLLPIYFVLACPRWRPVLLQQPVSGLQAFGVLGDPSDLLEWSDETRSRRVMAVGLLGESWCVTGVVAFYFRNCVH